MLNHLRQYRALTPGDRRQIRRAFVWLALVELALRLKYNRFVEGALGYADLEPGSVSPEAVDDARRSALWILLASRHHPVRARCLHRSLVLNHWLRDAGLPSRLRIGVRKDAGDLKAHAWVELVGQVVNDDPATVAKFTPLTRSQVRSTCDASVLRRVIGPIRPV